MEMEQFCTELLPTEFGGAISSRFGPPRSRFAGALGTRHCDERMTPAQDPFYIAKDEIQDSVDELDKAISVAERDPTYYGLNEAEIGRRWTSTAPNQVLALKRNVEGRRQKSVFGRSTNPSESIRSKRSIAQDTDEFIASQSDLIDAPDKVTP